MAYEPDQEPQGPRKDLLDRVPAGARVLDVGCWTGYYARYLRGRGCSVIGLERDRVAARAAAAYCEAVIVADLEDPAAVSIPHAVDAILLLDVLEHVRRPEDVLAACLKWSATATVYVSIPNVAHWSVRKALALGRWDYTDTGILDRTHVRFFTLETARTLIASAGYVAEWEDVSPGPVPIVQGGNRMRAGLARRWPGLFGIQFLTIASPAL